MRSAIRASEAMRVCVAVSSDMAVGEDGGAVGAGGGDGGGGGGDIGEGLTAAAAAAVTMSRWHCSEFRVYSSLTVALLQGAVVRKGCYQTRAPRAGARWVASLT